MSVVAFCILVVMVLIGHLCGFSGAEEVARTELRNAAKPPTWPKDWQSLKQLPGLTEEWLDDSFGFRAFLTDLNNITMKEIGSTSSDRVLVGKEGWLFHRADPPIKIEEEYRGSVRVPKTDIAAWLKVGEGEQRWLKAQGIPFVKVLFPNKQTVYPEYLPEWARKVYPNRTDLICVAFSKAGSPWIDTRKTLIDAKETTEGLLYYKTDTHWNHRGAYVAYRQMIKEIKKAFPETHSVEPPDFRIGQRQRGIRDLMRIHNFYHGWKEPMTVVLLNSPTHVVESYEFLEGHLRPCQVKKTANEHITTVVRTDLKDAPRVLIVRDSFTNAMAPFLNESFKEVLYFQSNSSRVPQKLVNQFKPDLVIFAILEKSLAYRVPRWKSIRPEPLSIPWDQYLKNDLKASQQPISRGNFEEGSLSSWLDGTS